MAQALRAGLRNGGIRRGGLRPGLGNGSLFAVAPLDLFFARNRTLDPRVTFTRASSGTYTDSQGVLRTAATNEPRFDHNPTTGESLGLLVEEQRTNLLLRSEEFDNASWAKNRIQAFGSGSVANALQAPDGASTADKIVEDNTTGFHYIQPTASLTVSSGVTITVSVYAKAGERSRFGVFPYSSAAGSTFNLSNGTVVSAGGLNASITAAGNGWYRCSTQINAPGTTATPWLIICDNSGATTYTGDGTSGLYIWGAQLEAGAFPTSYIPTTAATATRSADVASITGTNFSSWYRQDEGTVYAETRQIGDVLGFIASISDGTDNNRIAQFRNTVTLSSRSVRAGTAANPGNIAISSSQALVRSAIAVAANSCGASANGVLGADSAPSALPVVDRLGIGLGAPGITPLNGTIRRLTYWPARLANSTLQQLTQ